MTDVIRLAYSDVNSSGDTVLTVPSNQPIGTYLTVLVCSSGGGSTFTLTDPKGNTWHQREYASNAASPSAVIAAYTTDDAGLSVALTTSDTLTLTSTAGSGAGDILLIKVVPDTGGTLAYHNGSTGTGTGTAPVVASFTPAATDIVIAGVCQNSTTLNTSVTPGAGFTKLAGVDAHTQNRSVVGQYGIPGGATTAPFVSTINNQYATVAIAITQTSPAPGEFLGVCGVLSYNSTAVKTVNVPITNAVAAGQAVVLGVDMCATSVNDAITVTDTKGNTWHYADGAPCTSPTNGQSYIAYCEGLTTGLTTSDHLTVVVTSGGSPSAATAGALWCAKAIAYDGILGYDVSAHNAGASQNPDSGTTGAAAQHVQLVFAAFVGTGAGVTLNTLSPGTFNAETPVATPTTIRNLWIVWGFVNSAGTRHVTAHLSDNTSHPWAGAVAAFNSNAAAPDVQYLLLPDADGTGWAAGELVMPSGSGWAS